MKHLSLPMASLMALLLACGGGSSATPATTPEGHAAAKDEGKAPESTEPATEPGMGDEDRIPPKPKPFISVGSLVTGNQASTPASSTPVSPAEAEKTITRLLEIFVALGDGMKNAGEDCDAVATAISGWTQTYSVELQAMAPTLAALEGKIPPEREQEITQKLVPVAENIRTALQSCSQSPAVSAAVEEMSAALEASADKPAKEPEGAE